MARAGTGKQSWYPADERIHCMNKTTTAALALLALSMSCRAEPLPLWEVGAGPALLSVPDYRGSAVRGNYLLPAPYFVYRGERLKADRSGIRAALLASDRVKVELSLNGGLAHSSSDNSLRRGMPSLRPTGEIGPALNVKLWDRPARGLELRLPVRAVLTAESSPRHIGWLFAPNLLLHAHDVPGMPSWNVGLQAGPLFASRAYHEYFYGVTPEQAVPGRPAYAAHGGYSGTQMIATLSRRFRHYWVGAYLRQDWLRGAAFTDSPLVERQNALTGGIAVAWVFGSSSRPAKGDDTID
jgi:outer membrane scaffolding protein for murein synthesis (MipA/OmpV family)